MLNATRFLSQGRYYVESVFSGFLSKLIIAAVILLIGFIIGKVAGKAERMSNSSRPLLDLVGKPDTLIGAGSQQFKKIADMPPPGYDQDLIDPCIDQRVERVTDHWFVIDRQEMLVCDFREREEPRTRPARQNNAFHLTCFLSV